MNLKPKENQEEVRIGDQTIIPIGETVLVPVRENKRKRRTIEMEMAFFDDLKDYDKWKESGIPLEEYLPDVFKDNGDKKVNGRYDWEDTPPVEVDENNLKKDDFYRMEWKETQYHIYRLLLDISSSLSDIKEVLKNEVKK